MIKTLVLGTVGFCLAGPIGAVALGGLGAANDAQDAQDAHDDAIHRQNAKSEPSWNANKQRWETKYSAPEPLKVQPTPTRATTSRWVDPVDPAFTD